MSTSQSREPERIEEVWNVERKNAVPLDQAEVVEHERIPGLEHIKSYSILNGNIEDIEPYLIRSSIPEAFHWVPMNGVVPSKAIHCVDGYIKSHLFQIETHAGTSVPTALRRMCAIILGTTRAVMTTNYELTSRDIASREMAEPLMHVSLDERNNPTFKVIAANGTPHRNLLKDALKLTDAEVVLMRVAMRSAQAIVPIQGLNLLTDGHHYLSHPSKSSYKAFFAVEKQVWVADEFKAYTEQYKDQVRDYMWHKAGHPVAAGVKESAATSLVVKSNLEQAKLGSAAARLPALETEVRAAATYLKVAEAVDPIWSQLGGGINAAVLDERLRAVNGVSRGLFRYDPKIVLSNGVGIETRQDALMELRRVIDANKSKIAMAFGFYAAMSEATSTETGETVQDTLKSAHSLRKLKSEAPASYMTGVEYYRDYKAEKARARAEGRTKMPTAVLMV